ncbi:sodium:proton antiporter [Propionigenium maris DSM 9537]|uniref:Sodium:proton antiporter n=1 Tax=Propionigenium maris DSM 9537 TaxID=1123000 RepID=A0A9W6GNW3_9FUSO|nr:Na+/H+ antiporter NhaC family protein [Propionigenium maris]GLI57141.1 sodium:proton antiporter [Propionigenium maris DSM 9537]
MDYGWVSLLPMVLALLLAVVTRDVLIALLSGILFSDLILGYYGGDVFAGIDGIAEVFLDGWAVRSILFCLMIGSFVHVIEMSGGIRGLLILLTERKQVVTSKRRAELLAYLIGLLLFIEATSSTVISGVSAKPFFDRYGIPREKLAYITDSTSAPIAWLFPLNAAGAFLMAMVGTQISAGTIGGDPLTYVVRSIPFQLYSIFAVTLVGITIVTGRDLKIMEEISGERVGVEETSAVQEEEKKKPRAMNMILPTLSLILSIFGILYITGEGSIGSGNGSVAIFNGMIVTLILTGIYYGIQGVVDPKKYIEWCVEGMSNFLQITIILVLAFALSNLLNQLGLGRYMAEISGDMSPVLLPVSIFLLGSLTSVATGTSGGTAAVLMPIAIPMAVNLGVDIHLTIGAVVSSAVFGDHCSPISDSTILASMISEVDVMDHVKTQLPYALISGGISAAGFLLLGIFYR